MKQKALAFLLVLTVVLSTGFWFKKQIQTQTAEAAPQSPSLPAWQTPGGYRSWVVDGDILYMGAASAGTIGSNHDSYGYGIPVSDDDAEALEDFAAITGGNISIATADGLGGWYISGNFTHIGGVAISGIAHIESDGSLDAEWIPEAPDDTVNNIVVSGSDIFVSGDFTEIGGQSRAGLAKLNSTTGAADAVWNPNPNSTIGDILISGSDIFVRGSFTTIGGQTRAGVAKLNNTNGNADLTFNIDLSEYAELEVYQIALSGSSIYLVGYFLSIDELDNETYKYLLKYSAISGEPDPTWNSVIDDEVDQIKFSGTDVYIEGPFTDIGGQSRAGLAKLNSTTGAADGTWNPNPNGTISDILVSGTDIFVTGFFTTIGGQSRAGLAKLNSTTGAADGTWNPNPVMSDEEESVILVVSGSDIYAYGYIASIGGQSDVSAVKLDSTTGLADDNWSSSYTESSVPQIFTISGSNIFLGFNSEFDFYEDSFTRNYASAYNLTTNSFTEWNPNPNDWLYELILCNDSIFARGFFSTIGGLSRNYAAKLNKTTGAADPAWQVTFTGGQLNDILCVNDTDIIIGGTFTTINGEAIPKLAKVSATTGAVDTSWNPTPVGTVSFVDILDSTNIYVGGSFTTIDGHSIPRIAKINIETGNAESAWNPNPNGTSVSYASVIGNYLYLSGNFTTLDGVGHNKFGRVNLSDGNVDESFLPEPDNTVENSLVSGSDIYLIGNFTEIGGQSRNKLAKLNATTGLVDTSWNPNPAKDGGAYVNDFYFFNDTLLIGGIFDTIGGGTSTDLAIINATTGLLQGSWRSTLQSGHISKVVSYENSILAGGSFDSVNGNTAFNNFVRFDFPTLSLSSSSSFVAESIGTASIPLSLSVASDLATTVSYAVTSGNTIGGGTDYTLASGTATIPIGETSTNISVAIVDDSEAEGPEHLTVTISNPGGALLGDSTAYTLNINDNDHGGGSYSGGGGSSGGGASTVPPTPTPPASETLTINNGALTTASSEVTLQLSAPDQNTKVTLSTAPEFTGKPEIALSSNLPWNLCGGSLPVSSCPDGTYKVYAQFKPSDSSKPMVFVTKQIELNTQVIIPPPQSSPKPDPNSPDIFPRNLSRNNTGPDVFLLQRLLNNFGFVLAPQGFGSPGNETNFFGPRTQRALSAFQRFFLPSVTGRFDDATRSLVNSWMR